MSKSQQRPLWSDMDALHRGMPANLFAERVVLGSCLLSSRKHVPVVRSILKPEDFSVEKHRDLWTIMAQMDETGEYIDRVTLANRLSDRGKLESIGGLTYLVELDQDLPEIEKVEEYAAIIRDKAIMRQIIRHAADIQERCFMAEAGPLDILSEFEDRVLQVYHSSRDEAKAETFVDLLDACGGIDGYFRRDFSKAIQTPWSPLNNLLGYMQPGQLVCVAARPACGKTIACLQLAARAARTTEVVYYSLEETKRGLYDRLISAYSAVDMERLTRGADALTPDDMRRVSAAVGEIASLKLRVNDTASLSVYSLRANLMKLRARKRPAQVVVIDYLQLMRGGGRGSKRHEEISEITRGLKLLAEEMKVVIVIASQLNREVEKRPGGKPMLSDLRESGTIEQDSDKVIMLHRPELYSTDPSLVGQYEILVRKNRQGRVGEVVLAFEPQYQRIMVPTVRDDGFTDESAPEQLEMAT